MKAYEKEQNICGVRENSIKQNFLGIKIVQMTCSLKFYVVDICQITIEEKQVHFGFNQAPDHRNAICKT